MLQLVLQQALSPLWLASLISLALPGHNGDRSPSAHPDLRTTGTLQSTPSAAVALWKNKQSAFGMFVPSERAPGATDAQGNRLPPLYTEAGARALAANPLLDYLFLNLEARYDADAVRAMVAGVRATPGARKPTLLVRIPTIEAAGADSTKARVAQALALGADGVVIPHVRSADEARLAVSFFTAVRANVWSPRNPSGNVVAMLMIEDKGAVATMRDIAAVPGYSLLSCGIGSLTRDMGGDAPGAEAACQQARDLSEAAGMPSMMTATPATLGDRITRGYRGILLSGSVAQVEPIIRDGLPRTGRTVPSGGEAASASTSASTSASASFLTALRAHCGKAFEGQIVNPQAADSAMRGQRLVMHVRGCGDTVRVPFHVGDNRSRTWVFTQTASSVRLKHDHRHEDGSEDKVTQYGGDALASGTAARMEFAADAATAALIPAARTNVWTVEVSPTRFSYQLRREGTDRRFRVDFDLTRPVAAPPAPWGFERALP
ncbi:MAG: hypothetical protein IBJ03_08590 [Gemmatimonadaceae bacterium]|nr:hypothetical protein [Gemmatimonadaceae bacterium]